MAGGRLTVHYLNLDAGQHVPSETGQPQQRQLIKQQKSVYGPRMRSQRVTLCQLAPLPSS